MQLARGAQLGPYRICEMLGAGGMGEVYKAHDFRLNRFVAVKVMLANNPAEADQRRRLAQEARAASALNHPGIVTIYDVGSECGMDYIAMELVEGNTLESLIPRDGLPLSDILRYSSQVADALGTAHSEGVLHRDIKPGNLIVTISGQIKVLDFGLARQLGKGPEHERATCSILDVTGRGMVMGTAAYMSPEQIEGKAVDCRSDIFSFGAMLYEMLSGQRAFGGDTRLATIACILRDEPRPLRETRSDVPAELENLVLRCLRKDPSRRIQSMSEVKWLLDELNDELNPAQGVAFVTRPARKIRLTWYLLAVCAALLTSFAAGFMGRSIPLTRPKSESKALMRGALSCADHCAGR